MSMDAPPTEEEAAAAIATVDDDPTSLPDLRWMPLPPFWSISPAAINGEVGVVIVLANPAIPSGIPWMLTRDRALKFASQIRKAAQTGPADPEPPATDLGPRLWTPGGGR